MAFPDSIGLRGVDPVAIATGPGVATEGSLIDPSARIEGSDIARGIAVPARRIHGVLFESKAMLKTFPGNRAIKPGRIPGCFDFHPG